MTINRKKRSKGRGLATCMRIKIDAMMVVELDRPARNSSNFEDRFFRTAFCGQPSYSSIEVTDERPASIPCTHLCGHKSHYPTFIHPYPALLFE